MLSVPFSFLPLFLSAFRVRQHLLLCTPLIVFLTAVYSISLPPHERTKLQPHARLCCFLGYGVSQKGFRCYDHISRRLHVSRQVEFWEHRPFMSL